jgi:tetratricopeptide (TPR) repeat protein
MRSCIWLFYISLNGAVASHAVQAPPSDAADRAYVNREDLTSAKRAAQLWAESYARNPQEGFDSAWKLARADYWLGGHVAAAERRGFLEQGIDSARKAVALQPSRPEGHFWLAANMGALAESAGLTAGLRYRKPIREELQTVLRLDPAYEQGSADRGLGRWYFKVPRLFGGSLQEAEQHLRESLTYNPHSTASHYFLAEVMLKAGREEEGRRELVAVLDAPLDPEWAPEDREFKDKAQRLLSTLKPPK